MTEFNNINKYNPNQFKPEPYIAKTYDVAYLESLYPELSYQDVSIQRGYGPVADSPDASKYCSSCKSNKEVNSSTNYCPTCGNSFGTVAKKTNAQVQASENTKTASEKGGKSSYSYTTNSDGSVTETADYAKQ